MFSQFDQGGLNLAHAEEYILNSTTIHYREYMKQFEYEQKIDKFASTTFNFEKQLAKVIIIVIPTYIKKTSFYIYI